MGYCLAEFGEGGVLLDVDTNRYVSVDPRLLPTLKADRAGAPLPAYAAAALRAIGVLPERERPLAPPETWSVATRRAFRSTERWRFRDAALAAMLHRETKKLETVLDERGLRAALDALRSTRGSKRMRRAFSVARLERAYVLLEHFFAGSRDACVKRSLGLASLGRRLGHDAKFFIGVKKSPFAAHAWVEIASCVLNSAREEIDGLTPILMA